MCIPLNKVKQKIQKDSRVTDLYWKKATYEQGLYLTCIGPSSVSWAYQLFRQVKNQCLRNTKCKKVTHIFLNVP